MRVQPQTWLAPLCLLGAEIAHAPQWLSCAVAGGAGRAQVGTDNDVIQWDGCVWSNKGAADIGYGIAITPSGDTLMSDDADDYFHWDGSAFQKIFSGQSLAEAACVVSSEVVWFGGIQHAVRFTCKA